MTIHACTVMSHTVNTLVDDVEITFLESEKGWWMVRNICGSLTVLPLFYKTVTVT